MDQSPSVGMNGYPNVPGTGGAMSFEDPALPMRDDAPPTPLGA